MMFRTALAACALALVTLVLPAAPAGADELGSHLYGVDDAQGASVLLEPTEEGFAGTYFDPAGNSQEFTAQRIGESAETVLQLSGGPALMRISPLPYGAEITFVPLDADGNLLLQYGRKLSFVRSDLNLPKPGPDFVPAPRVDNVRIAANGFLASYEFWDPTGVRNGYLSLPPRFRTLLRLFPAVQLDVIWKLCLAPAADEALAIALRGQGVTCPEVLKTMADAQRSGRFMLYKAEVGKQKEVLRMNVRCADGFPESKQNCDRAAKDLSAQAVALETAATVLNRYR